jgi:Tfp pilus tip-associated adhesin PilY1
MKFSMSVVKVNKANKKNIAKKSFVVCGIVKTNKNICPNILSICGTTGSNMTMNMTSFSGLHRFGRM